MSLCVCWGGGWGGNNGKFRYRIANVFYLGACYMEALIGGGANSKLFNVLFSKNKLDQCENFII